MILVKTEAGQQVFKDRSVRLTPRQRSAFILFDGKRSVADVLAAGMGIGQQDIDQMIQLGMLEPVAGTAAQPAAVVEPAVQAAPVGAAQSAVAQPSQTSISSPIPTQPSVAPARTPQQRYQEAYPIATRLTAGLGLRGFRLNLSVEAALTYEQLAALAPKIRAAVGDEKAAALEQALGG